MKVIVDAFNSAVEVASGLSVMIHQTDSEGSYCFGPDHRALATEAAFLRTFVAFEEFLEASFIHYGTGGCSLSGKRPICYASPLDDKHLHNMFKGSARFVDWSSPERVKDLAGHFFEDGVPFAPVISGASGHLRDMKTVRNASAHASRTTVEPLKGLHLRWTGKATRDPRAYDMLIAENDSGETFMKHAETVLKSAVGQVVDF